jgi:hypothetical protein
MAIDFDATYGTDFACVTDLDAALTVRDNRLTLGESLGRRLLTPRGGLFHDRSYGYDVRRFLKASGFTEAQIARVCEAQMLEDERVRNASVSVTFDENYEELTISARVYPVIGQAFDLTLNVDSLSVELLNEDVVI